MSENQLAEPFIVFENSWLIDWRKFAIELVIATENYSIYRTIHIRSPYTRILREDSSSQFMDR